MRFGPAPILAKAAPVQYTPHPLRSATHRRMFPFTPSYLKHGRQFIKDARKLVAYKRDLVNEETLLEVEREISHLEHAVAKKDKAQVHEQMQRLDQACGKL